MSQSSMYQRNHDVPILIQPEDWMQYHSQICQSLVNGGSNPHPARRLDAIDVLATHSPLPDRSNPHPARRLDAIAF